MVLKIVGSVVSIIIAGFVILSFFNDLIETSHQNESPTLIKMNVESSSVSNMSAYLSEQPSQKRVLPPPEDDSGYQAQCTDEWTKRGEINYEMVNYCERAEREGYLKLVDLLSKYGGYSWMSAVLNYNINQWTKRGARKDSQVAYGVGREVDAFLNLQYLAQHGSGIKAGIANDCLSRWARESIQWTMVEYCYKQETGSN